MVEPSVAQLQPKLPAVWKHPGIGAIPKHGSTSAASPRSRPTAGNSLNFLATPPRPPPSSSSSSAFVTPRLLAVPRGLGTMEARPFLPPDPAQAERGGSCEGCFRLLLWGEELQQQWRKEEEGGAFPPLPPAPQPRLLPSPVQQPRAWELTHRPPAPHGCGWAIFSPGSVCARGFCWIGAALLVPVSHLECSLQYPTFNVLCWLVWEVPAPSWLPPPRAKQLLVQKPRLESVLRQLEFFHPILPHDESCPEGGEGEGPLACPPLCPTVPRPPSTWALSEAEGCGGGPGVRAQVGRGGAGVAMAP